MVLICVLPQVALWGKGKVCPNRTKFTLFTAIEIACGFEVNYNSMMNYCILPKAKAVVFYSLSPVSFFVRFDFVFLLLTRDSSSKLGSPLARSSVAA